ncbi:MAG: hypothetical protein LAQ30_20555 [Acidobacteriia bacterium]|nr:hypothetical protein [Terriglobia bacterium]
MISPKLVRLIEEHGEQIISRVISQIRREPQMTHIHALMDTELREWGRDLLEHLGHWLSAGIEEDLARRYERIGRVLCEQEAPLSQCLRGLFLIREKVMDYLEEQVLSKTHVDLYAEEETERRLNRFFDLLVIHLAHGYERALRKAAVANV